MLASEISQERRIEQLSEAKRSLRMKTVKYKLKFLMNSLPNAQEQQGENHNHVERDKGLLI